MKQWLLGVVGASLLSSIALVLCPGGRVRSVTKLVCGLVCMLALVQPLLTIDFESLSAGLTAYSTQAQEVTDDAEKEAELGKRTYIQDECAAYISAEAQELGLAVGTVSVSALWDQDEAVWYPYEVTVDSPYNAALSGDIEKELGVPAERQHWSGDE